jgi:hypothetical protein
MARVSSGDRLGTNRNGVEALVDDCVHEAINSLLRQSRRAL